MPLTTPNLVIVFRGLPVSPRPRPLPGAAAGADSGQCRDRGVPCYHYAHRFSTARPAAFLLPAAGSLIPDGGVSSGENGAGSLQRGRVAARRAGGGAPLSQRYPWGPGSAG